MKMIALDVFESIVLKTSYTGKTAVKILKNLFRNVHAVVPRTIYLAGLDAKIALPTVAISNAALFLWWTP